MLDPLAQSIVDFWFVPREGETVRGEPTSPRQRVTRDVWFRKDDAFDAEIRTRFGVALAAGLAGAYGDWCHERCRAVSERELRPLGGQRSDEAASMGGSPAPVGCLARVVLLDQFTRNAFRGTPQAFAGDAGALATAEDALERGFDRSLAPHERWFLYMPFVHSESLAQQDRAVALFEALAGETGLDEPLPWTIRHRDIVRRFGRFPHRNEILGRASTPDEVAFLKEPGSRF